MPLAETQPANTSVNHTQKTNQKSKGKSRQFTQNFHPNIHANLARTSGQIPDCKMICDLTFLMVNPEVKWRSNGLCEVCYCRLNMYICKALTI